ncbi:MAG: hypothetical protein AB1782_05765 [Cyanobacteriota bacterium]
MNSIIKLKPVNEKLIGYLNEAEYLCNQDAMNYNNLEFDVDNNLNKSFKMTGNLEEYLSHVKSVNDTIYNLRNELKSLYEGDKILQQGETGETIDKYITDLNAVFVDYGKYHKMLLDMNINKDEYLGFVLSKHSNQGLTGTQFAAVVSGTTRGMNEEHLKQLMFGRMMYCAKYKAVYKEALMVKKLYYDIEQKK